MSRGFSKTTQMSVSSHESELLDQIEELKKEIEERKQADAIKNRFSFIIEETVNEIYVFEGSSYRFVHCNQTGCRNLGYSYEEMNNLTVLDIKKELSVDEFSSLLKPLRDGSQKRLKFNARHFRKDGSSYPVEIHLQLMPDKSPLFVAIILDISERLRNEEILRASEERFRTAFEAADDCILIWDRNYNYLYANQSAIDHVGLKTDTLVGKNIEDGLGHIPDFMKLWRGRIDKVLATGESLRVQDETNMMGRHLYTDSILSPLRDADGDVYAVYVVYRDISEFKKTENFLQSSLDIINMSPAVAFLWKNEEGWPVEYVSENVKNILGYTADDFISGKESYSCHIHPDDLDRVVEEVGRFSRDENCQGFTHEPYRLFTKTGETLWVDDRTTIKRNKKGEITHFQGIVLDISPNIEAEEKRKVLENSLYQSDKMASIGQLAAGVAHEVNNPIGFISSNLKTMAEYIQELKEHNISTKAEMTPDQISELLDDFEEAVAESLEGAARVKKIVSDMMGISRLSSDKMENSNINTGIDSTLNIVWNQIKDHCRVEKDFGNLPQIKCFKSKINQVFLNLLVNAGHAVEGVSGIIKIKTWADDEQIYISISDNGCGIPEENLPRLFEAFYTTKEVGQGTGLGLSLSHDIVQQHGGSISVKSEVGKGTEFIVSLPIVVSGAHEKVPVA